MECERQGLREELSRRSTQHAAPDAGKAPGPLTFPARLAGYFPGGFCPERAYRSDVPLREHQETAKDIVMSVVDLSFGLTGGPVRVDHGYPLFSAISRVLPQLHADGHVGVHPLHGKA